jgi:hypothetical protein
MLKAFIILFIFFLSCSTNEVIVPKKRVTLEVLPFKNSSEYKNLSSILDKKLKSTLNSKGIFTVYENSYNDDELKSLNFSRSHAKHLITCEVSVAKDGFTRGYFIPYLLYFPYYLSKIEVRVFLYDLKKKRLVSVKNIEIVNRKFLGFSLFTFNENDPDYMITSRQKNELIESSVLAISEEISGYLIEKVGKK